MLLLNLSAYVPQPSTYKGVINIGSIPYFLSSNLGMRYEHSQLAFFMTFFSLFCYCCCIWGYQTPMHFWLDLIVVDPWCS